MNWIDIALLLVIILSVIAGYKRGFLLGGLELSGWIVSVFFGFTFYPFTASFFTKHIPALEMFTLPLAFILTIFIARLIISFLINIILGATSANMQRSSINKVMGIIPGFINGLIFAILFSALIFAMPLSDNISETARNSTIANNFATQVEWLNDKISPVFDKAVNKSMNKLTVEPESDEIVTLPFKTTEYKERPDLEAKMLIMINDERKKAGLQPLKADPQLRPVALAHSADMFTRGYFAHLTPEGKDPFDRMRQAHVKFFLAGENLALAQTLEIAHEGLMHSKGHRENILRTGFGRVGLGILDAGKYGVMVSQEFRNP